MLEIAAGPRDWLNYFISVHLRFIGDVALPYCGGLEVCLYKNGALRGASSMKRQSFHVHRSFLLL